MADPIKWDSKILLLKVEANYGVDPTPTGNANAVLAKNIELRPMEGEDVRRDIERPYGGAQEEIPVGLNSVLTFETEYAGSGTAGTAPAWGPLMRISGCAETITAATSVEYTPITDNPESGTLYMWIGPTLHKMLGARATFELTLNAQGIPVIRWTVTGLFVLPATQARPAVDLSGFIDPLVATKANTPTFTVGELTMKLRSFTFSKANDVQKRFLVNDERIVIVNSDENLSVQVEAVGLGTYNPYDLAIDRTKQEIELVHGTGAGNVLTLTIGSAQQKRLSAFQNAQNVQEWPLQFKALPDAGNDQFSLLVA